MQMRGSWKLGGKEGEVKFAKTAGFLDRQNRGSGNLGRKKEEVKFAEKSSSEFFKKKKKKKKIGELKVNAGNELTFSEGIQKFDREWMSWKVKQGNILIGIN